MQPGNFFYVIMRNGQIFEIEHTFERFSSAMQALTKREIFSIPAIGIFALNGADISEVLDDRQFINYISTVKPTEYPRYGVWYNKKGDFLRYESWKKDLKEAEKKKKLKPTFEVNDQKKMTPEEWKSFKSDTYKKFNIKK